MSKDQVDGAYLSNCHDSLLHIKGNPADETLPKSFGYILIHPVKKEKKEFVKERQNLEGYPSTTFMHNSQLLLALLSGDGLRRAIGNNGRSVCDYNN